MTLATPVAQLLTMLTYKRPHDSPTESEFVSRFLLVPYASRVELLGPMRNIVIVVGDNPTTLFSCHTDTVHFKDGVQQVEYDPNMGHAYKKDGECLGADDGAGVWIMLQMIEAGITGAYVFHRGEERGGIGSTWMSNNKADWLKTFKRAVAFDRKGEDSVITKQRGSFCCSTEFAKALAQELSDSWPTDIEWKMDPTGTFTDTANYTHLIPECTNISVGYYDQHTKDEMLNVEFLLELAKAVVTVDWEALPTARTAKREVPTYNYGSWNRPSQRSFGSDLYDDDDDDRYYNISARKEPPPYTPPSLTPPAKSQASKTDGEHDDDDSADLVLYDRWDNTELSEISIIRLLNICRKDPLFAAMKISELLDSKKSMQSSTDSVIEMCLQQEADNESLSAELDDLYAEIDEYKLEIAEHKAEIEDLKKEMAALLRRKRIFNFPSLRQRGGN